MESKFSNTDNFERFLRDKADEFKMYPSRRVWYSIYNNMHPGNRMPSVAMSIILICALLLTGYLNTSTRKNSRMDAIATLQSGTKQSTAVAADKTAVVLADANTGRYSNTAVSFEENNATKPLAPASINNNTASNNVAAIQYYNNNAPSNSPIIHHRSGRISVNSAAGGIGEETVNPVTPSAVSNSAGTIPSATQANQEAIATDAVSVISAVITNTPAAEKNAAVISTPTASVKGVGEDDSYTTTTVAADNRLNSLNEPKPAISVAAKDPAAAEKAVTASEEIAVAATLKAADNKNNSEPGNADDSKNSIPPVASNIVSESDKAWIENYAMYNKSAAPKWKGKLSWQGYITPGIVYRTLTNNTADKVMTGNGNGNFNNSNVGAVVKHKPSFGIEAGVGLQYDLMKRVKVRGALQVNYTRYNALAYENQHPISTSLTMNGNDGTAYEVFRSTIYSSNLGLHEVKLHNETLQLSIPMGADFRISTLGNISWYAGATIQPTVILKANSYLISSDRRNYVKDQSMLNRFNLNAGFETYLSIKTDNYTWQVGPQFRSQIFSTNNKLYSVEERLMTFGIKLGITKRL